MILELFPQVKERVETVWHQDVLEREEIKREDVNVWPINSCRFIALILLFAQATKAACATLHKACGRISRASLSGCALRVQVRYVHGHVSLDRFAALALNSVSINIRLNQEQSADTTHPFALV